MIFVEGDLRFDFTGAISARKFDNEIKGCGLNIYSWKSVDFIVELSNSILFIEVKDPQHRNAKMRSTQDRIRYLTSSNLIQNLILKCRHSYLYEHSMNKVHKPIFFIGLICIDNLTISDFAMPTNELRRQIPVTGPPNKKWVKPFIKDCFLFNLKTWNAHKDLRRFPVVRI
jgi:hypothetical protein